VVVGSDEGSGIDVPGDEVEEVVSSDRAELEVSLEVFMTGNTSGSVGVVCGATETCQPISCDLLFPSSTKIPSHPSPGSEGLQVKGISFVSPGFISTTSDNSILPPRAECALHRARLETSLPLMSMNETRSDVPSGMLRADDTERLRTVSGVKRAGVGN
jgi:hypothetical protein